MTIEGNNTGKCPHCNLSVRFEFVNIDSIRGNFRNIDRFQIQTHSGIEMSFLAVGCPACGRVVLVASHRTANDLKTEDIDSQLWPDTVARSVPTEVESESAVLAEDFREAVAVFPKSKKASAALSRRCLQYILREKAGTKSANLSIQIDEVLDTLPTPLAENLDSIRQVGNFAAHPMKYTSSGEIVEVEEGEAEWLLDVLEDLFDYYYVSPAKAAKRREALNKKLIDLGKPPLKSPDSEPETR